MNSTSPTTVMVGIFAILIGLASAYGVRQAMTPAPQQQVIEKAPAAPKAQPVPMRTIVLAKENIAPFTTLTKENLNVVRIPEAVFLKIQKNAEEAGNPNAFPIEYIDSLLNRVARTQIMAGKQITEDALYEFGKVPMLEEQLDAEEIAMAIPVDHFSSVAGFLHPNSRVNISWMPDADAAPGLDSSTTFTICKNVRVLATSAQPHAVNSDKPQEMTDLTLAVNQNVANVLTLLQKKGTFSITMSGMKEEAEMEEDCTDERVNIFSVLGIEPPEGRWPLTASVDSWKGTARHNHKFSSEEVLEAHNATRVVMLNEKPLKKAPKISEDPDTVPVD